MSSTRGVSEESVADSNAVLNRPLQSLPAEEVAAAPSPKGDADPRAGFPALGPGVAERALTDCVRGISALDSLAARLPTPNTFAAAAAAYIPELFMRRRHAGARDRVPSGRPTGSGAATRQDLPHLVLVLACDRALSPTMDLMRQIRRNIASCAGVVFDESVEESAARDEEGRRVVQEALVEAENKLILKRSRVCFAVEEMDGFAFVTQYATSERLARGVDDNAENISGANRAACCWLNVDGSPVCSCAGSSALSAMSLTGSARDCCEKRAMVGALYSIADRLAVSWGADALAPMLERFRRATILAFSTSSSDKGTEGAGDEEDQEEDAVVAGEARACELFGAAGRLAVVVEEGRVDRGGAVAAPVRLTKRNHPVCCYCVTSNATCSHVRLARAVFGSQARAEAGAARERRGASRDGVGAAASSGFDEENGGNLDDGEDVELRSGRSVCLSMPRGLSREPLPLVNCVSSIDLDYQVGVLARDGGDLVLQAPGCCAACGSRDGVVEKLGEGVVIASGGAVARMIVEFRLCTDSKHGDEGTRTTTADGNKHGIVLSTCHTGVTHRLMRSLATLHAGSGCVPLQTLLRELREASFSEQRAAAARGLIMPPPRSSRSVRSCIYLGMQLMVSMKESGLFTCRRCTTPSGGVSVLATDAIFLGHQRKGEDRPFNRQYLQPSLAAPPKGSFRRQHEVVDASDCRRFLSCVLRGDPAFEPSSAATADLVKLEVPKKFAVQGLLTLAVLSEGHVGCVGPTLADVAAVGGHSVACRAAKHGPLISAARGVSTLVTPSAVARFAGTLQPAVAELTADSRRSNDAATTSGQLAAKRRYTSLSNCERRLSRVAQGSCLPSNHMGCLPTQSKRALLNLVLQVVCDSSIALLRLGQVPAALQICKKLRGGDGAFDGALSLSAEISDVVAGGADISVSSSSGALLLKDCRLLRDAVIAASSATHPADRRALTRALHDLISAVADTAAAYYDSWSEPETEMEAEDSARGPTVGERAKRVALQYQREWSGMDVAVDERAMSLRQKFKSTYPTARGNPHDTGICMPDREQCRPLPFYGLTGSEDASQTQQDAGVETLAPSSQPVTEPLSVSRATRGVQQTLLSTALYISIALLGACSKKYLEAKRSFSPGAFTLCCTCSHPKMLGFVVLDRAEGPLVLLNVLLGFFAVLPDFLVYDFSCGAFRCAVLTLPFLVAGTQFVSDLFHMGNHVCTAAYNARSYTGMDGRNSVAHEQRNRAIHELQRTLRSLNRANYITVLWFQAKYLNYKAMCDDKIDLLAEQGAAVSREAFDGQKFYLEQYPCSCCAEARADAES